MCFGDNAAAGVITYVFVNCIPTGKSGVLSTSLCTFLPGMCLPLHHCLGRKRTGQPRNFYLALPALMALASQVSYCGHPASCQVCFSNMGGPWGDNHSDKRDLPRQP